MAAQSDLFSTDDPVKLFELTEEIATGSYGSVYKAIEKKTNEIVALKIITLEPDESIEEMMVEIRVLKMCHHATIVGFHGAWAKNDELFIAMELCSGGSILDITQASSMPPSEDLIALIIRDTLKGIEFLHSIGVIHRDIKSANLLTTDAGDIKLTDFGVSAVVEKGQKRRSVIGTPYWMAPEVANGSYFPYDEKCDIWSVGATCLEIADLKPPNCNIAPMQVLLEVISGPPPVLENPAAWSDAFVEFIALCLVKEPRKRKSATDLLQHPWIGTAAPRKDLVAAIERRKKHDAAVSAEDHHDELIDEDDNSSTVAAGAGAAAAEVVTAAPTPAAPETATQPLPPVPSADDEKHHEKHHKKEHGGDKKDKNGSLVDVNKDKKERKEQHGDKKEKKEHGDKKEKPPLPVVATPAPPPVSEQPRKLESNKSPRRDKKAEEKKPEEKKKEEKKPAAAPAVTPGAATVTETVKPAAKPPAAAVVVVVVAETKSTEAPKVENKPAAPTITTTPPPAAAANGEAKPVPALVVRPSLASVGRPGPKGAAAAAALAAAAADGGGGETSPAKAGRPMLQRTKTQAKLSAMPQQNLLLVKQQMQALKKLQGVHRRDEERLAESQKAELTKLLATQEAAELRVRQEKQQRQEKDIMVEQKEKAEEMKEKHKNDLRAMVRQHEDDMGQRRREIKDQQKLKRKLYEEREKGKERVEQQKFEATKKQMDSQQKNLAKQIMKEMRQRDDGDFESEVEAEELAQVNGASLQFLALQHTLQRDQVRKESTLAREFGKRIEQMQNEHLVELHQLKIENWNALSTLQHSHLVAKNQMLLAHATNEQRVALEQQAQQSGSYSTTSMKDFKAKQKEDLKALSKDKTLDKKALKAAEETLQRAQKEEEKKEGERLKQLSEVQEKQLRSMQQSQFKGLQDACTREETELREDNAEKTRQQAKENQQQRQAMVNSFQVREEDLYRAQYKIQLDLLDDQEKATKQALVEHLKQMNELLQQQFARRQETEVAHIKSRDIEAILKAAKEQAVKDSAAAEKNVETSFATMRGDMRKEQKEELKTVLDRQIHANPSRPAPKPFMEEDKKGEKKEEKKEEKKGDKDDKKDKKPGHARRPSSTAVDDKEEDKKEKKEKKDKGDKDEKKDKKPEHVRRPSSAVIDEKDDDKKEKKEKKGDKDDKKEKNGDKDEKKGHARTPSSVTGEDASKHHHQGSDHHHHSNSGSSSTALAGEKLTPAQMRLKEQKDKEAARAAKHGRTASTTGLEKDESKEKDKKEKKEDDKKEKKEKKDK